jgi:hypothetical protein
VEASGTAEIIRREPDNGPGSMILPVVANDEEKSS